MLSVQRTDIETAEIPESAADAPDSDEARLLARMLDDDPEAWRQFTARYSRLIFSCISRVTCRFSAVVSQDDVREIYAMLCVQLLSNDKHKLRTFEPSRGNKLGSWLGMLAVHTAYDYLRSVKREPQRASLTEAECLKTSTPDPYDVALWRERAEFVSSLLQSFTEKDREFITLYYGEGLSPEQIAERMGISVKTVYSKKHKIRSRLELLLGAERLAA
jgi:RNA polymerase sigma-70 factor (ECF subfamily)